MRPWKVPAWMVSLAVALLVLMALGGWAQYRINTAELKRIHRDYDKLEAKLEEHIDNWAIDRGNFQSRLVEALAECRHAGTRIESSGTDPRQNGQRITVGGGSQQEDSLLPP